MGAVGDGGSFSFPVPAQRAERLFLCQRPAIVVALDMLEVEVLSMAIIDLSAITSLNTHSINIDLALYLFPTPPSIYPLIPVSYSLYLVHNPVPVPVPGLYRHQSLDFPRFPPILSFASGLIFPPQAPTIPGRTQVYLRTRKVLVCSSQGVPQRPPSHRPCLRRRRC